MEFLRESLEKLRRNLRTTSGRIIGGFPVRILRENTAGAHGGRRVNVNEGFLVEYSIGRN